jgi:DNA-binding beta-propeller fold protein YncE
LAPQSSDGPYHIIRTAKVGGDGGFDYVYADPAGRAIYVARTGQNSRINVYNLDSLEPSGEISKTRAHGAVVDPKSHHGFSSSKPLAMWDTKTLAIIKTIDVDGSPDGILGDPVSQQVYILSHSAPNVTVINAIDGSVVGTVDVGGAPEQSAVDGKGHLFVDLEDKGAVAVVDTTTLKVINTFSLGEKFGGNAGLAFDVRNHVLFVACREPAVMVMMDSITGKVLGDLPIGTGCDGAGFNPKTHECFSSQGDGTLTIIKEVSPTKFVVEQTLKTMPGAKTMTIDPKTGKVFLISAEWGAPADTTQANGRRPRRGALIPGSFSIIEVGK